MPKITANRITDKTIKTAKPKSRRYEIRDAVLPGFMLRVSPAGSKAFYVQLERGSKRKIGNAAVMTLTRARTLALSMLQRHDAGEKIESRLDKKLTLEDFVVDVYGPWAEQSLKTGANNVNRLTRTCQPLLTLNQ